MSYTSSETVTYTKTHARYIAAKVAPDLKRFKLSYGVDGLTNERVDKFQQEIELLLLHGYLESITYGLKRNNQWVVAIRYESIDGHSINGVDDDPGGFSKIELDTKDTQFHSFLIRNQKWSNASNEEKQKFKALSPVDRGEGVEPIIVSSLYWMQDKSYSSANLAVNRKTIRSY